MSIDGKQWTLNRGYCCYSRNILWDDGIERVMGNLDRPFIYFENGKPRCVFFAVSDGTNGFMNASNTWNMAIPIKDSFF